MKIFIVVFILSAAAVTALYLSDANVLAYLDAPPQAVTESPRPSAPTLPPPNLPALAAALNGASAADSEEEDSQTLDLQVQSAREELNSADVDTRLGAIEQLAAYPTREAEQLLTTVLQTDSDDDLRTAAATALSSLRDPGRESVAALSLASIDQNETLRQSALTTLEIYITREAYGSTRTVTILRELERLLKQRKLAASTKEELIEFIREHKP